MKVQPERLLPYLEPVGFRKGFKTLVLDSFTFVRKSRHEGLFESIIVQSAGRHGEAVVASVGVAITRRVMYKELGNVKLLDELAEVKERGWTIIRTDQKAKTWEERLTEIGPSKVEQWATEKGPMLADQTDVARRACIEYCRHLDLEASVDVQLAQVRSDMDSKTAAYADRIASCTATHGSKDERHVYELASLCVLGFSKYVEKGRSFLGVVDPLENRELMWRIELVADELFWRCLRSTESDVD